MRQTLVRILFLVLLSAQFSYAERFRGYIWDKAESALLVEGIPVRVTETTKIERKNHKGITFSDLRIGWEVDVDGDLGQEALHAKKIKVRRKRYDDTDVEGYVVVEKDGSLEVDGKPAVWADGATLPQLQSGMHLKGEGIYLDDGTIQIDKATLRPIGFNEDEAKFMGLVSEEVHKLKEGLPYLDDPELQAYISTMGQKLVPSWAGPEQFNFTFSVIADPSLNAFALPDGTVVIHTGLLTALENEAQFATVIGHEIAHATHLHGYRGYKHQGKMKWLQIGAAAGGIVVGAKTDSVLAGVLTGIGSSLTLNAVVNGHGRDLEDDADRIGLQYMVDAGYDYTQAPEVWRVFNERGKDQGSVQNFFFSDHSTHRARISNLTREINTNYRGKVDRETLVINEDAYQRATAKIQKSETPE